MPWLRILKARARLSAGPLAVGLASLALAACASSESPVEPILPEGSSPAPVDAGPPLADLAPHHDVYAPMADAAPKPDYGPLCQLGTADNCADCGDVCPPGKDTTSTTRLCTDGECDIQCGGEAYDVNGDAQDGCEALDDLPIHDSSHEAVDLGSVSDCSNVLQTGATMPSDDRWHLAAPTERPLGREDWFKLHISDNMGCIVNANVDLDLSAFPASAAFVAEAYHICDAGPKLAAVTQTGKGGSVIHLDPSVTCTTMGDDSGTLYIRLAKTGGPHHREEYLIKIDP